VPADTWSAVAARDRDALVTQTAEWLAAACASSVYRDASRLYEMADGRQLILPLVVRGRLVRRAGSFPAAWGIGGLVGDPYDHRDVAAVLADVEAQRFATFRVRPNPIHGQTWADGTPPGAHRTDRTAHVVDLSGGWETVSSERIHASARRRARKAERLGVQVEMDDSGRLIQEFYGLLEKSFVRWGERQREPRALAVARGRRRDPIAKFHALAAALGPSMQVWIARLDGAPLAGVIVLLGRNAHYTRGAMDAGPAAGTEANYLLQVRAIEAACEVGCGSYHMGETGASSGLAQFKTRFGAVPFDYAELSLDRIPLSKADRVVRSVVKRAIGFRDDQ
jgi:hypothetical protein